VDDDEFDQEPVLNPDDVVAWIREIKSRIAKGVRIVTEREAAMKAAKRDFDLAFAHAFKNAQGSEQLRKQTAVIDAMPHRERFDNAEIAFNYAKRTAESLERELFAAMSINRSVRGLYQAAGIGET
jgi:hypothetical protein